MFKKEPLIQAVKIQAIKILNTLAKSLGYSLVKSNEPTETDRGRFKEDKISPRPLDTSTENQLRLGCTQPNGLQPTSQNTKLDLSTLFFFFFFKKKRK